MEIIINNINEYEKKLSLTVPWEMISEDYNDLLKKYMKLPVKGFRQGRTPAGAIESFFRNQIKDDLLMLVSTRLCRRALKEKNIVAGSPIEIVESELQKKESLRFKATFIEMPQFNLPEYKKLNLQTIDESEQLDEISEKLLNQTDIELPSSFVEAELRYSEESDGNPSQEDKAAAEDRVKLMLILKKIADQDSIEIDERDIEDRIKLIAEENEVSPEEIKAFFMENGGTARLADSLLAEQVLKYIISIQE